MGVWGLAVWERRTKPSEAARLRLLVTLLLLLAGVQPRQVSAAARPALGANLDLTALNAADRTVALSRLADASVSSIRMQLDWNRVEPKPGKFSWAAFDTAVNAARAKGMDVVLVLGPCAEWAVNPAWQVAPDQRRNSVPKSPDLWIRYVKAAVTHFRDRVHVWQIREQPNARSFRGARSEYLSLLNSAHRQIHSLDPGARVIIPEGGFLDIAAIDQFLSGKNAGTAEIVGIYAPADIGRAALPWAVLTDEVMEIGDVQRSKSVWMLGIEQGATPDACQGAYLFAWAFGAEQCFLPASSIGAEWTRPLLNLTYDGFSTPATGAWMLYFTGPSGSTAIAWSPAGIVACSPAGQSVAGARSEAPPQEASPLQIGPQPTIIPPADWLETMRPGAPRRADVLAARGCSDLSSLPMVYMDLSIGEHPELGLSNRALRALGGGACTEEQRQGRAALRTCISFALKEDFEKDNPWLYFDVDDSWLYFDRGKTSLVVTVECEGSFMGPEKLGFNIAYDSTSGYRFTPWQWVAPGYQWRSYHIELKDVNFANRDGWDFRINAKGSVQDLWVSAVTVEKEQ